MLDFYCLLNSDKIKSEKNHNDLWLKSDEKKQIPPTSNYPTPSPKTQLRRALVISRERVDNFFKPHMAISLICDRWRAMASIAVLALLLLIFQSAKANDFNDLLAPLLSPIFENVCKEVNCGKGTCKASGNGTFSFECDCDSGWKKTLSDDDDDDGHFKFLPCIIPKCNLTHSCSSAPPPGVQTKPRTNESIFDPCSWVDCGGGSCNKTSPFTYKCDCLEGYYNLLNITTFACYKDCSIGMDCKELGIPVTNTTASTTSSSTTNNNNAASGLFPKRGSLSTISSVVVTCVATLLLLTK